MFLKSLFSGCRINGHDWEVTERSNVLQQDGMGYPLRLCIVKCKKCGLTDQHWLDTNVSALKELDIGKSVLLHWEQED